MCDFEKISLKDNENFSSNSEIFSLNIGGKYETSSQYKGTLGKEFSAYFGIVLLNKEGKEIARHIQWMNDFSNNQKDIKIVFTVPENCNKGILIYRINSETPVNTNCQLMIKPINQLNIIETSEDILDEYDHVGNFVLPFDKELTEEEEDILEKNLVWIFASARSGTTWLGGQLLSHETLFMNEPLLGRHLGQMAPNRLKIKRDIDYFRFEPNYFFATRYKNTWKYFLRKLILNRIFTQYNDLSKKIIIKEPNGSFGADIIADCLPNAKIIFLVRDCRDIVDSALDARKAGSELTEKFDTRPIENRERKIAIKKMCRDVRDLLGYIIIAFENHNNDLKLLVKYEDLLSNTVLTMKNIYKFLEIQISEKEIKNIVEKYDFKNIPKENKGKGKFYRFATPGKWKEHFNLEEQKMMNSIMADILTKVGYNK